MMKSLGRLFGIFAIVISGSAAAQTAAELRGGWVADIDGTRHIYIVKIEEDRITGGLYCHDCLDFDNVAFIREGTMSNGVLDFTVLHDRGLNAPYVRKVHAELVNGKLMLSSEGGPTANASVVAYERQPRVGLRPRLNLPEFNPSGPGENLSVDKVSGRWVAYSGLGDRKQYMMLRSVDGEIKGLVCGPCLNVHQMGPIEHGTINGDDLYIEIMHEDTGTPEGLNNAPNYNMVHITIVDNEMHMTSTTNTNPPDTPVFKMMFVGPLK
ncbi:MAG: hypothetical protein H6978_04065 [Gammaproteobacteria bacterium]|nr:hypothetical protein [Gammaproteobacteria bacterium]